MEAGEWPALNASALADWTACAQTARQQLLQQTDLVSQMRSLVV
jgi:hypothetical protein